MPSKPTEAASTTAPAQSTAKPSFLRSQKENLQILAIALVLALFIRTVVAEPRFIPSDSMVPTLHIGDRLVVEKVSYRLHPPVDGDVVVFEPPAPLIKQGFRPDQALIKRVMGTPGQTVRIEAGTVFVDDRPLDEPYIAEPPAYRMPSVTVPPEMVFVMGDNRNNSNDSHVWGFLPQQNIIGRAIFRFFPIDRIGSVQ